ncbi:integrase [Leifsonia sp. AK011]|uniref:tyrosine-type recombinase/integrase n=1 Tax=Leifsonia sp. AK011 TaxID=2723075 RepID=UPI0015CA8F8D|nr:site-specific integrase [Leifsonia sp. AK011]NYF10806.1 integrase [Leifsonia sp. AK011]
MSETTMTAEDCAAFAVWEAEMRAVGCAERTIKERRINFRSLGRFLGKPVLEATRSELVAWLGRPDLSPKTRQNYKSFLHTFFTLMQDEGLRLDNPGARLPRGKSPRIEANPFSTSEVQALLDSGIYGRTRMMVMLAAYQGFRAVEIAATSGANIDWERGLILTVEAKGGSEVWRPLHPAVATYAKSDRPKFPVDSYWFPGIGPNRGGHINAKSVSNTLSQAISRAGIAHRPHQLRAWFATELLESGADMLTIQHAMRHASPATLRHYIRPSLGNMTDSMNRLPTLRLR